MYQRQIQNELEELATNYPVVTLSGPRQSGKTTLVRSIFSKKPYANLEDLELRGLAKADPKAFLAKFPEGAVLDEIQQVPELLSYIQVIVDEKKQKGMFILTGSHQLELHQAVSQSLAGRTALLYLLPMSLLELKSAGIELSLDEALYRGGFPRVFTDTLNPSKAYRNYLQTYIEKDLRQLINIKDLSQFQNFLKLCAGRVGQMIVVENLSNDLGVSSHTIKHWLSILEASFIIFRLQPYFENFGKRVVKSAKLYFTDVGLASYLLGIETLTQISRDPLRGNLIENLMVLELMKARYNVGLDPKLYYFRDSHGHEVDLIFQFGNELVPIEIKAAQTFNKDFLKGLRYFMKISENRSPVGYLVYGGTMEQKVDSIQLLPFSQITQAIE